MTESTFLLQWLFDRDYKEIQVIVWKRRIAPDLPEGKRVLLQAFFAHYKLGKPKMDDWNPSPASSSSSAAVGKQCRRLRRHAMEDDGGDPVACTGKSCQSCTAGVIADCIAVCCCPCAVVNILALAFFKLPWAVARKCLGSRKKKSRRRMLEERRKSGWGDRDGISEKVRVEDGTSEIGLPSDRGVIGDEQNDNFSAEFRAEEVWLELYEVGHLGFGRVSFTGVPFHNKGN